MDSRYVKQAEALLAEGKEREARELLLHVGYGRQFDKEAQDAYLRLFPPGPELQRQLEGPLKLLLEGSLQQRRAVAKQMAREARDEYHVKRAAWLGDPRTTGLLLEATSDEDPEVVESAMLALSNISGRYLADQRILPVALRLLDSKRKFTRLSAVSIASQLGGFDVYEQILPLCRDKAELVRQVALASVSRWKNRGDRLPEHVAQAFLTSAIEALKDPSSAVRMTATSALQWLGLPEAIEPLNQALAAETHSVTRDLMEGAIKSLREVATRQAET